MQITYTHEDGRSYSYLCRDAGDAGQKLLLDLRPRLDAAYAARGERTLNVRIVPSADGKWTETRTLSDRSTETRRISVLSTSAAIKAAPVRHARMPAGLTAQQQAEWRYDQGANEGGEGYNPHRNGSARSYR